MILEYNIAQQVICKCHKTRDLLMVTLWIQVDTQEFILKKNTNN